MTRGLNRRQLGVTEAMIEAFGDTIMGLSNNLQIRRGDPVRNKDFAEVEAQRPNLGLSDLQISRRIGIGAEQVTYIRNMMERRRFRKHHYHRLNVLGGGRRFRRERFRSPADQPAYADNAMRVRAAMRFPPELAKRYVEAGWWRDDTLSGWLARNVETRPEDPAMVSGDLSLSWSELSGRVARRAAGLHALGVNAGDVVTVQLPNSPEFLECYLAIARLGAVTSTLYLPHRAAEMKNLLAFAGASVCIVPDSVGEFSPASAAAELKEELPHLQHVVCHGETVAGTTPLASVTGSPADIEHYPPPVAADPFLLLFTSGTSAAPKAVPLSYHNMLSNARLSAPEHGIDVTDTVLSAAPFGHLYALYSFHLALCVGARTALLPVFSPPELIRAVREQRPGCLFAGPAHMAACMNAGLLDEEICASLKLVVMSGSAVSGDLVRQLSAALVNGKVSQLWGMTETQAGLYTRPHDPVEVVAMSAGRPSPGTEARVVDEQGEPLPAGREGELQVRGCLLFPGYLDNEAANETAFAPGGWFRTGDLAICDEQGNVSITGRIKELINRGGVKYNPRDVEALLDSHPSIAQSAIVPIADEVLGERACCFVVAASGETPTLAALCDFLLERGISKIKLPERLELVESMPMTPTRKVIKGRLGLPS